jgi:hypothetical protein
VKKRDHLEDLGVDGRITNSLGGRGMDRYGSGQGRAAGCCERDKEAPGSVICGYFLD